ncbi:hypothetical protein [Piscinibacter sp.]|uniref:hypothetical protein n=1 Tax=Piscinibacter sp. TaxID=1903157 RepID=UPI002CBC6BCF|nr:hypothetical protein [Albitalea sp.]HUG23077.1 hypothetical protein [Albitalea sp.]
MRATPSRSERVAVIAVHGVADQRPGATARMLAGLLVASPSSDARYAMQGADEMTMRVDPLPPTPPAQAAMATARAMQAPTPNGERPLGKAFAQSMSSDRHRSQWVSGAPAPAPPSSDAGVALTEFLLFKAARNGTPATTYETACLHMTRSHGGSEQPVDVYEMYWADLSRLSDSMTRIVAELFTLMFRLSQLGRDTVTAAARQFAGAGPMPAAWRWLNGSQIALDWAFSKGLALLVLQLLMLALVIVPTGAALRIDGFAELSRQAAGIALPAIGLLWALYWFARAPAAFAGALLAIAALGAALWLPPAHAVVGVLWLLLLSLGYDWLLRVFDERFPATRFVGWLLWPAVLAAIVWAAGTIAVDPAPGLALWITGALFAVELVLLSLVAWWGFAGAALFVWLVAGQAASNTPGFGARASVATGRLGLFVSMGLFLVLTMTAWAAVGTALGLSVGDIAYRPLVFTAHAGQIVPASEFLEQRYVHSTETFSVVAVLMMVLVAHLVATAFPSVLAELQAVRAEPGRLGRWLTVGYRTLDLSVTVTVVFAVLAAMAAGAMLVSARIAPDLFSTVHRVLPFLSDLSQDILQPMIYTAASLTVALSALGGMLSRYARWLRAPLDVALDVDSHFREFPRQGIPRASIFARYYALLRHLSEQGYDRIVVVAHSQGTVISAELFRYLDLRAARGASDADEAAAVWRQLRGKVHLLTAGCPLRQLYAARFPALYRWVLPQGASPLGPTAGDVGVERWVNVYTTGDYVGRWLWSRPAQAPEDLSDALVDEVAGAGDVYLVPDPMPALDGLPERGVQLDVCLGAGAHTHYFDAEQGMVAALIDQLIATSGREEAERPAAVSRVA